MVKSVVPNSPALSSVISMRGLTSLLMAARPTRTPTYGSRRHPVSTRSVHGERLEGLGRLEGVERLGRPEAAAIPTAASSQQLLPSRRRLSPPSKNSWRSKRAESLALDVDLQLDERVRIQVLPLSPLSPLSPVSPLPQAARVPCGSPPLSPLHHAMPPSRKLKPSPYLKQLLSSEDPTLSVGPAPLQPVHRRLSKDFDSHTQAAGSAEDLLALLRKVPFFSGCDEIELQHVLRTAQLCHVKRYGVLIRQGTLGSTFYMLLDGELHCANDKGVDVRLSGQG